MSLPIQRCANCNAETGRCAEDSRYVWRYGPLCEDCHFEGVEDVAASSGLREEIAHGDAAIARLRAEVETLRAHDEDRRIGAALRALVARGETAGATLWHGRYVVRVGDISEASHAPTLVEAMEKAVRRD